MTTKSKKKIKGSEGVQYSDENLTSINLEIPHAGNDDENSGKYKKFNLLSGIKGKYISVIESSDYSIYKIKVFAKKMIFLLMVVSITICGIIYSEKNITKLNDNKIDIGQSTEQTAVKSMLINVIEELSRDNNKQYALDENYYNEEDIKTYISIVAEKDAGQINIGDIKQFIWDIFLPVKNNDVTFLVKKDNETLIMECASKKKMNMLDHAFMGLTNSEINEKSKGMYISQNNDEYEKIPYGTSNIKSSGCGPISLTMAINYINESNVVSLESVIKWAEENNMYEDNSGTKWSLLRNFPGTVNTNCTEMYIGDYESFKNSLAEDEVYITTMEKGSFTDTGHFIVITEIKNEKVSVLDSASICRSLKEWDAQVVFAESKKYFWKLSRKEVNEGEQ